MEVERWRWGRGGGDGSGLTKLRGGRTGVTMHSCGRGM